jgi:hypothetical protein
MSLKLEAIRAPDESDRQIYQKLMEKSKTEQSPDKAATLGTQIP